MRDERFVGQGGDHLVPLRSAQTPVRSHYLAKSDSYCEYLKSVEGPVGFEPTTPGLKDRNRSSQPAPPGCVDSSFVSEFYGAVPS